MKRRDFFLKSAGVGLGLGAAMSLGSFKTLTAGPSAFALPDMAAVRGGEPDVMFDRAIAAMGGMGHFVKKGQKVVVKPNIGWDVPPERAANTNPLLIKRIVQHCYQAGAKEVLAFDNTCDAWTKCYKDSGIEKYVKSAGGKMVPGNTEGFYQEIELTQGKRLKKVKVHELVLDADVFIDVPVLKSHDAAKLTISMKNLMGVIWDRRYWHRNDLNQCIADYATYSRKPDLVVVDAYNVMMKNGPRGVSKSDVVKMKAQIVTTDMVAADAAAAKMFGVDPASVRYIRLAHEMHAGNMDLSKLNISRIKI
ncbi:MAG: DUF362 domain-containing protein [Bacteroidales bacterium]|nr:DUF362 domain-containing protein [Bacteroidales bacterium]